MIIRVPQSLNSILEKKLRIENTLFSSFSFDILRFLLSFSLFLFSFLSLDFFPSLFSELSLHR